MIQPLRTAHRRVFVALALILPAMLALGLRARPRVTTGAMGTQMANSVSLVSSSDNLWQRHAIRTEYYRDTKRPPDLYLVLRTESAVNEPDLLVYWSSSPTSGNTLPADAQLVGQFANGKALLLAAREPRAGHLILFSLAHQSLYDATAEGNLP